MKVAFLVDAVAYPLTGIGRYCWQLVKALHEAQQRKFIDLFLFSYLGEHSFAELQARAGLDNVPSASVASWRRSLIAAIKADLIQYRWVAEAFAQRQDWSHRRLALRAMPDILHGPNYVFPPKLPTSIRKVVTIHDLSFWIDPSWHPEQRVRRLNDVVPRVVEQADSVLVPSLSTADMLEERFPGVRKKITVTPLAVDRVFFCDIGRARERRGVLCVSTIEPRKNVGSLVSAYRRLPRALRCDHPLTIIGDRGWASEAVHSEIRVAQAEGILEYLGYVREEELVSRLASARLVVYPSLHEGFGLPVLEALAAGTPVLAGKHSSIPEVAGTHGILINDLSVQALAAAIEEELRRPWDQEAALGRQAWARRFDWNRTVMRTFSVYRSLIS